MKHRTLKERAEKATPKHRGGFGWFEMNASGEKVAIIMHGITGGKDDMLVLAERYADLGYAVYCPDLPGHGDSVMIEVETFEELGNWLHQFIDELGRTPDLIVSNSYASAVVYQYMQLGHLPDHTHVVLGCPTPRVARFSQALDRAGQLLPDRFSWRVYNTAPVRVFRTRYLYRGSEQSAYKWLVESEKRKFRYIAPHVTPKLSGALFGPGNPYDLPPLSDTIQRRITVVVGERDNVINTAAREYLRQILPLAKFVSAGPAGHILHFEAVDSLVHGE